MPKLKNQPATNKVMQRWPDIAKALVDPNVSVEDVAEKYDVTPWSIWNNMQSPEFQDYFHSVMDEKFMPIFLKQAERIEVLWNSEDPRDRRLAITEARHMYKLQVGTRSYQRTENLNVSVSQERTELRELLEIATPEELEVLGRLFRRVQQQQGKRYVEAEVSPTSN